MVLNHCFSCSSPRSSSCSSFLICSPRFSVSFRSPVSANLANAAQQTEMLHPLTGAKPISAVLWRQALPSHHCSHCIVNLDGSDSKCLFPVAILRCFLLNSTAFCLHSPTGSSCMRAIPHRPASGEMPCQWTRNVVPPKAPVLRTGLENLQWTQINSCYSCYWWSFEPFRTNPHGHVDSRAVFSTSPRAWNGLQAVSDGSRTKPQLSNCQASLSFTKLRFSFLRFPHPYQVSWRLSTNIHLRTHQQLENTPIL